MYLYRVFWRAYGAKVPEKLDTSETSVVLTGLQDDIRYECVVKAANDAGELPTLCTPRRVVNGWSSLCSVRNLIRTYFDLLSQNNETEIEMFGSNDDLVPIVCQLSCGNAKRGLGKANTKEVILYPVIGHLVLVWSLDCSDGNPIYVLKQL